MCDAINKSYFLRLTFVFCFLVYSIDFLLIFFPHRNERFQEELLNFSMEHLKNYITDTENQFNNLLVQKDG